MIFPFRTVKPLTETGRPRGATTAPAAALTSAGRTNIAMWLDIPVDQVRRLVRTNGLSLRDAAVVLGRDLQSLCSNYSRTDALMCLRSRRRSLLLCSSTGTSPLALMISTNTASESQNGRL